MNDPASGGLATQVGRGVLWSLAQAWGGRLISTSVLIVLARLLSPDDFGLIALAAFFVELGGLVVDQGLGASIVQRRDLDDGHLDTAFWTAIGSGCVAGLAVAASAGLVASALDEPDLADVLRVLAFQFPLAALGTVHIALLQRRLGFAGLAARRLIAATVSGAIGVALAFAGAGVWALVAQSLSNAAVGSLVVIVASSFRPRFRWSRHRFRDLFGFSSRVFGVELVSFGGRRGEDLVLGAALGATSVGLYAVATRLLRLVVEVLTGAIGSVAFPTFARIIDDIPRAQRAYIQAITISSLVTFPAFIGLSVLSPYLVIGVFGDQWSDAAPVMALISLTGLPMAIGYFSRGVRLAGGMAGIELRLAVFLTTTRIIAALLGMHFGGLYGMAVAVTIQAFVVAPVGMWTVVRVLQLPLGIYVRELWAPAVSAGAMGGAVWAVTRSIDGDLAPLVVAVVGVVAGAALYGAIMFVLGRSMLVGALGWGMKVARPQRGRDVGG